MARPWVRVGLTFAVVLLLDQLTKALVRGSLAWGAQREVIPGVLHLERVHNRGIAFGLFSGSGLPLALVTAVVVLALLVYFQRHLRTPWAWLPTGLLLGGAVGNLLDRLRVGSVTDFIKFPHFPAFNVADIAITFGVIALVLVIDRDGRHAGSRV